MDEGCTMRFSNSGEGMRRFCTPSLFAGHMMTLGECEDGTDGFELIYLGSTLR